MSINYPAKIFCPKCGEAIKLTYDDNNCTTRDILTMQIGMPYSIKPGKDQKNNKQDLVPYWHTVSICQHCFTILGIDPRER